MSYQVQGIAYDTRQAALTALVAAWVSNGGEAGADEVVFDLSQTDTAADIISEWGGDLGPGNEPSDEQELAVHIQTHKSDIIMEAT